MDGVGSVVAHNLDANPRTDDVRLKELAPFSKMLLKEAVRKGLAQTGFVYPTVIQATAIPMGKSGLDLLVQSKSGTGKTLIFATVVLEAYRADVPEPQSLVVAPTREIAVQIESVMNQIGRFAVGFRACSVIGGLDVADDRRRLQGARAVVGTPGRLLHLIQNEVLNTAHMRLLVLDEADKMYTASFRHDLQRIERALPSRRQTIACSATFCDNLDKELARIMRQPLFISTEHRATLLLGIKQFAYELPEQKTSILEMQSKLAALADIFGRIAFKQCVIFAGSQSRADSYRNYLEREGWPCELMSGAQDQRMRLEQFKKFREFRTRILVATDLMSRGIDSDHVNLVINLELPGDVVTYLHRIGRAGRFGSHGIAISFVASEKDRCQLKRLISKVGSGLKLFKFPNTQIEKEKKVEEALEMKDKEKTIQPKATNIERDLWDFTDEAADQRHFGLFGQELIAPLASQDHVSSPSQEDEVSSPNKENHTDNICPAATAAQSQQQTNSSSIDTNTFRVDSKDSAFNMLDLLVDRPDACKQQNLTSDSRHSSTQQLPSSTSNTIDDASSIAADSLRSSQQDISRYQSVLMQKAAIPTLVEFLVDKNSSTTPLGDDNDVHAKAAMSSKKKEKSKKKPQIDFFEDYKQTMQLDSTEEKQEESLNEADHKKVVSRAAKLATFKSLLIDKPEQTKKTPISAVKQKDIYSDYANFNAADDDDEENELSNSISQPTTTTTATEEATTAETTEDDFVKATFILSVATLTNKLGGEESIEELQNSSLDLSRGADDKDNDDDDEDEEIMSELPSLPEKQHFPSPAHNQPPPPGVSSIPDVVPPKLQMIMPTASQKVMKLSVNVGAKIEIPPQNMRPQVSAADVDGNGEIDSESEADADTTESSLTSAGVLSAAGEGDGGGGGSSGFDEATSTSASSGIETSEVAHESYQTSPEGSESEGDDVYNYYTEDDSTEEIEEEPLVDEEESEETDHNLATAARPLNSSSIRAHPYNAASTNMRWIEMYRNQILAIQDYVSMRHVSENHQPPPDDDGN